jgi:hypothetical protein
MVSDSITVTIKLKALDDIDMAMLRQWCFRNNITEKETSKLLYIIATINDKPIEDHS